MYGVSHHPAGIILDSQTSCPYIDVEGLVLMLLSLTAGKTLNTKILTSDNVTLGAWFVLADPYYQSLRSGGHPTSQPSLETIQAAIQAYPTILYLHGAAGRRSTTWRVQGYNAYTSRMQSNVLVIDYRGFGDSEGSPSEAGLASDAYAAWTWLVEQGARSHDVLIYGHSLGTGVAGKLGSRLARENVKPRGIVLTAPFSSLSSVVETYNIFGFPVLQPLQQFAWGRSESWLVWRSRDRQLKTF